jgi:hypothetical protein
MAINYSLCLVARRNDCASLLEKLSVCLDAPSRARIASLRWSPEVDTTRRTLIGTTETDSRGIAGLRLAEGESPNAYCFALNIQLEREFEANLEDHRFSCFGQPGSFGCMWTSIYAGLEFLLLEMQAATSGMSQVLMCSEAIHAMWVDLAKEAKALFAYVNIEQNPALQLFPNHGDLWLPDCNTLGFEDGGFSVDRMAEYLLATNGG